MFAFLLAMLSAIATVTKSKKPPAVPGSERVGYATFTFTNSYTNGGDAITAKQFGLRRIDVAECWVLKGTESAVLRVTSAWYEGGKLHLLDSATGKEVVAASDVSKVTVLVKAIGS
jgi:hypothetical protein